MDLVLLGREAEEGVGEEEVTHEGIALTALNGAAVMAQDFVLNRRELNRK